MYFVYAKREEETTPALWLVQILTGSSQNPANRERETHVFD